MPQQTETLDSTATAATGDCYDILARVLHWIFAAVIIYATISGFALEWISDHPLRAALAEFNASITTLLIPLFPLRVVWKFIRTDPPSPPVSEKLLKLAYGVHDMLYLMIFLVLVTGFLMMPHGYMFFGLFRVPTPYEKGEMTELFANIHSFCTAFLAGLVCLHVLGVLHHTLFTRINILRRMLW